MANDFTRWNNDIITISKMDLMKQLQMSQNVKSQILMQFLLILSSILAQITNVSFFFQVKLCEYKATERDHESSWPLLT